MNLIEKFNEINAVIESLIDFIKTDDVIKQDFAEYLKTFGFYNSPKSEIDKMSLPYIFERQIGEERSTVLELFNNRVEKLSKNTKFILSALKNTNTSIFEVKKILKNGFELYNLINEKTYQVNSLQKMTNYRGVGTGQYVMARVFEFEGDWYLIEITNILAANKKNDVHRFALAKIVENPQLVYMNNSDKLIEIEKEITNSYGKFIKCFGKDEIVTTNKYADELLDMFNSYDGECPIDIEEKLVVPDAAEFFNVRGLVNDYGNFIEKSLGGFSSHNEIYDVGIIFDKEYGLYAVPFWKTFNTIFQGEKPEDVKNYEKCIEYFLNNEAFSANLLKRVADRNENFVEVVNSVLKSDLTLEDILRKYKSKYMDEKIFSSTSVLFNSKVFLNTLGLIEEKTSIADYDFSNAKRNEPCPCGSGKKFKNCCMHSVAAI